MHADGQTHTDEHAIFRSTSGVDKRAQKGPNLLLPNSSEKNKHTFKLHKICQFGQLILRKVITTVATRSHILKV